MFQRNREQSLPECLSLWQFGSRDQEVRVWTREHLSFFSGLDVFKPWIVEYGTWNENSMFNIKSWAIYMITFSFLNIKKFY